MFFPNLFFATIFIVTNGQCSSFTKLSFNFKNSEKIIKSYKILLIFQSHKIQIAQIIYLRICDILGDPLISGGTVWKMEKLNSPNKQNQGFSASDKFNV